MDTKSLDGIYAFMKKAYQGNWQYRASSTPFMAQAEAAGRKESVLSHMWALMEFWFQLRRICKELNKAVDSIRIYEIILNHDLSETLRGDTPLVKQVSGLVSNNEISDSKKTEVKKLTASLQKDVGIEMTSLLESFESNPKDMQSIEMLVAKFLDYLQGDHFCLVFGNNLPDYSVLIGKVVRERFALYTQRLIDILKEKGFDGASMEVRQVAEHHMEDIRAAGIKFEFEGFK